MVLFFLTSKQGFARMTDKSTVDNNDGCNDNYDSNDGSFDDYMTKITTKNVPILGTFTL